MIYVAYVGVNLIKAQVFVENKHEIPRFSLLKTNVK